MRLLAISCILLTACFLLSCQERQKSSSNVKADQKMSPDTEMWHYQLATMDEAVLEPSKVDQIRIIVTRPFGGETTIIKAKNMGPQYQVVMKVAEGGINELGYVAKAVGYSSEEYRSRWEAALKAIGDIESAVSEEATINDFSIAGIEVVKDNRVHNLQFLFCGKEAKAIIAITDLLLMGKKHDLTSNVCPLPNE